jgi:hypothetical protein
MHIANFATDVNLLKSAQEAAKSVIEQDPELKMSENSQLKDSVMRMIQNSDGTLN